MTHGLRMVHEVPCADHPCDNCSKCRGGRCCRGDDPDYGLPEVGSWQPVYGSLGRVNQAGDTIECHACGGWYESIGRHAWASHDLTPAEYRSSFGLAHGQSLAGSRIRARVSEMGKKAAADAEWMARIRPTPEHTAMIASRPNRMQVRESRTEQRRGLVKAATAASHARPRVGRSVAVTCPDCGRVTMRWPSQVVRNYQRCSDCHKEARRNRMTGHVPRNAKIDEATAHKIRQRYAEGGISQTQLAAAHGVSQSLVSLIVRGKVWPSSTTAMSRRYAKASDTQDRAAAEKLAEAIG